MAEEHNRDDKTEDPTHKRLEEALKRGDVVKSQEVGTWFVIAGGTLALAAMFGSTTDGLKRVLGGVLANAHQYPMEGRAMIRLGERIGIEVAALMVLPILLLMGAGLIGNLIQHRPVFSSESLKPKLSKVSPMAGWKRLFSKQAQVNFLKGLVKLGLVGTLMTVILFAERQRLSALVSTDMAALLPFTQVLSLRLLGYVVAVLGLVAALDYLYQYRTWFQRQKMTLQEVKEEYKQTEGDPVIRGKLRQLRQTRMRKRMMAQVPTASVVLMNPTHYAVALRYEAGMNAPVCVAKGVDALALRIRDVAEEHRVPVVENPPLARALHATVKLDEEIPVEHYKAVADVIGYIMRLKRSPYERARYAPS